MWGLWRRSGGLGPRHQRLKDAEQPSGQHGTCCDPAVVPKRTCKGILGIRRGKLGLAVFGDAKGGEGEKGEQDGSGQGGDFEAGQCGEDQPDGRADHQGLLRPLRMRAKGFGDVAIGQNRDGKNGKDQGEHMAHGNLRECFWEDVGVRS